MTSTIACIRTSFPRTSWIKLRLGVLCLAIAVCASQSKNADGVFARGCRKNGQRLKCYFVSQDINFEPSSNKDLELDINGRTVKCKRRFNKKNKGNRNRRPKRRQWYGRCDGEAREATFVQISDRNNTMHVYGSLSIGQEICRFGEDVDGEAVSVCEPQTLQELDPIDDIDGVVNRTLLEAIPVAKSARLRKNATLGSQNSSRRLFDDSGSNLDIMVVWTNEAECLNSGLPITCVHSEQTDLNMRGLVHLAVEETNIAFQASGIDTELRLVHAYRDSSYEEPSSNQFYAALAAITSTNDGNLDDIHQLRSLYGADIVAMIHGTGGFCGVAHLGPSRNRMFSVTKYSCATGYFSFGHEIAHNLGCFHDRAAYDECSEATFSDYRYGFRDPGAAFRSIMAYDCRTSQCDALPSNGCPRVQFFSNDENLFDNEPMGDAFNDNARRINDVRSTVAGYFQAWDCSLDLDCDDGNSNTADTCNVDSGVCEFVLIPTYPPSMQPVSSSPTRDLSEYSSFSYLESFLISGVTHAWTTVGLSSPFTSPVPVCSVKYDSGSSLAPAVVRMRAVSPTSFEIRLQEPSTTPGALGPRDVSCLVVEAGSWELPDGNIIEAFQIESTVTDSKSSWVGEQQSFVGVFNHPVVIGQVQSYNDARWSVFWSHGADAHADCADQSNFWIGKHVGEDPTTARAEETVGYIVMEKGIHSRIGEVEFDVGQVAPDVVIVSQCKMVGLDGGWAVLTSDATESHFGVAIDEDIMVDSERAHIEETVNYLAFSGGGPIALVPSQWAPSTAAPSTAPSAAPSTEPTAGTPSTMLEGSLLQVMVVPSVTGNWVTVPLAGGFSDPIPVCSVVYSGDPANPTVVRMQNVVPGSFEIRLQNPTYPMLEVEPLSVHCLVVEMGSWEFSGGRIEAKHFWSTVKDKKNSWLGEEQVYEWMYTDPVVLGQVMTFNNEEFTVFWSRGTSRQSPPSSNSLRVGKHTGEDNTARLPETVGYIVFEGGMHMEFGGLEVEANTGADTVTSYVQGGSVYSFLEPFAAVPEVVVVSQSGMIGNDGSWAVLTQGSSVGTFGLAIDEDEHLDSERWHVAESISYAAFSIQGTIEMPFSNPSEVPTYTPSGKPSFAPSSTPSKSPSSFPSSVQTEAPSRYPSQAPTNQPSDVLSDSPSDSRLPTVVPSDVPSKAPSVTPTGVPSDVPTQTPTSRPSRVPSETPSVTSVPTAIPSTAPSKSPSISPTEDPSGNPTEAPTHQPSIVPSGTPSESGFPTTVPSDLPSKSPSNAPSYAPTEIPSQSPTNRPSKMPSENPSVSSFPTTVPSTPPSNYPSVVPSGAPSGKPTQAPTRQPSGVPSETPSESPLPTVVPTHVPSEGPSNTPTDAPTEIPSQSPTYRPSMTPSATPSVSSMPTDAPTNVPSKDPTHAPTYQPSGLPSATPSESSFPTVVPSNASSNGPSTTPTGVPTEVPTQSPTSGPSITPSGRWSYAPSSEPTAAPSPSPSLFPSAPPTQAPSKCISQHPSILPSSFPTASQSSEPTVVASHDPTQPPTRSPSHYPSIQPSVAPTESSSGSPSSPWEVLGSWEAFQVPAVTSEWLTVPLVVSMVSPVAVCSVQYDSGSSLVAAVVRMRNVQANSFEIRLQNPTPQSLPITPGRTVHCLAVEEGSWELPDGRLVEAAKYTSTVTDRTGSWIGETQALQQTFSNPIVVGQVMSSDDTEISVFWSRGDSITNPPNFNTLRTGKHTGQDTRGRSDELVGYIVMEGGLHSLIDNVVEIEANRGGVTVQGYIHGTYQYMFTEAFTLGPPEVTIVSQSAMKGNDGSWAVLTVDASETSFGVAVDEDSFRDAERWHLAESVDYIAVSNQGYVVLTPAPTPTTR